MHGGEPPRDGGGVRRFTDADRESDAFLDEVDVATGQLEIETDRRFTVREVREQRH
jgi:hypothetical protein